MKQISADFDSVYFGTTVEAKDSSAAGEAAGRHQAGDGSAAPSGGAGSKQAAAAQRQARLATDRGVTTRRLSRIMKDDKPSLGPSTQVHIPTLGVGFLDSVKIGFVY